MRYIEVVADLPKTATGKNQRFKFRELAVKQLTAIDSKSSSDAAQFATIEYGGKRLSLENAWIPPENPEPLIVFPHEGRGSPKM